jgi:hypothetical protein
MDLEAGTYFIEIIRLDNSYTGTYTLRGNFIPAGNNEIEPNNTRATAHLLTSGQTVKGFISLQDERDMYRYDLAQPGRLTVNITGDTLQYANVQWLDIDGTQVRRAADSWLSSPYNVSMDLEAGTYFIEIIRNGNNYTGTYNLTIR